MSVQDILKDKKLTRRSMLKAMSASVAAAALAGCGGGGDADTYYDEVVSPQDGLTFDTEMSYVNSTGLYNCGCRCHHKMWVKNGRFLKVTSDGDRPREGSFSSDESQGEIGNPVQRRGCVRCYSYIHAYYQPDRLKYPMIQRGNKGDINGFERVSWDEAIDATAEAFAKAIKRRDVLGYTPLALKFLEPDYDMYGGFSAIAMHEKVAPVIITMINESNGCQEGGMFDTIGLFSYSNAVPDRLNTKFMITWSLDPTRGTYHIENGHWYNTCVKENGSAPIVVISPNHHDSAAMLSTGTSQVVRGNVVNIPSWVAIRPATDGALATAMCYVIYKNKLYDENFINDNCFGFFKNDECVGPASSAVIPRRGNNATFPHDFTDADGKFFPAGTPYAGAKFRVPDGSSFEEYLISLENDWGGAEGNELGVKVAEIADEIYMNVLEYTAKLTGVPSDVIEALAIKYATTKPSFLDVGGGAQRAQNGIEFVRQLIVLSAMTGNTDKMGGGAGLGMQKIIDTAINMEMTNPYHNMRDVERNRELIVMCNSTSHVVLTGKDYRKRDRFIEDCKMTSALFEVNDNGVVSKVPGTEVDVSKYANGTEKRPDEKLLEIDVIFSTRINKVATNEDINKSIRAYKEIGTVILNSLEMSTTAQFADIILPSTHLHEQEGIEIPQGSTTVFMRNKFVEPIYDTKTDNEIKALILAKLSEKTGIGFDASSYVDAPTELTYNYLYGTDSQVYKKYVDPSYNNPTFEKFKKDGMLQRPIPKGAFVKTFAGDYPNNKFGELETSTGKINFYSPLWGLVRPATPNDEIPGNIPDGYRHATAKYQPNHEGFETYFDNGNPRTGKYVGYTSKLSNRTYKLQYMTNKARNRAHTVLDNVGIIKDQFEQNVKINPADAASRGINDGDLVYVYNDRGCMKIPAMVTQTLSPGVVSVEHGAWYRPHPTETVTVWQQTKFNAETERYDFEPIVVPVDIGGAENLLTYDFNSTEILTINAISAQGGHVEVSLIKPE
jgi:anaerobic dimethyl sulfoxide reductase subunit A